MEQNKGEIIDLQLVNFLLKQESLHTEKLKSDEIKKTLRNILRHCTKKTDGLGYLETTRKLSDDTAHLNIGRRWIQKKLSLGSLPRNLRNFLTAPHYWDIDAKCCQPTLAWQYAKRHNLYMPTVEHYTLNSDSILQESMDKHKITRKQAKDRLICLMYNSKSVSDLSEFEIALRDEFAQLAATVWLKCPGWHDVKFSSDKTIIRNTKNYAHKLMSHFLQTEERKMLDSLDKYLVMVGRSMDIPMHDGGNVRKRKSEHEFPVHLLKEAEDFIEKDTGYKIQLVQKPIEHTFNIDEARLAMSTESIGKDNEAADLAHEFERNHFLMNGVLYKIMDDYQIKMITNTHVYTAHIGDKFWRYYIINAKRRYDDFGFYVYGDTKAPSNKYNTFHGFAFEKLFPDIQYNGNYKAYLQQIHQSMDRQENIDMFNESKTRVQLQEWLCNDNADAYEYLIQWLARIINEPQNRSKKAIVLKNACGGTGKTGFFSELFIKKLLGSDLGNCDSAFEEVFGDKNGASLAGKMFFMCNEAEPATTKKYMNKIKEEITDSPHRVRFLYKDSYWENNLVNFIFNTNKDSGAIQYERDNMRRFVYIDCAEKRLTCEEQIELASETSDPDFQRMFLWMLIDKYEPKFNFENMPFSQTVLDCHEATTPVVEQFIRYLFVDWNNYVRDLFKQTPEGYIIPCNWHLDAPKTPPNKNQAKTNYDQKDGEKHTPFNLNRDQIYALYSFFLKTNFPEYKRCNKFTFGRDKHWKAFVEKHMEKSTHGQYSCDWHKVKNALTGVQPTGIPKFYRADTNK